MNKKIFFQLVSVFLAFTLVSGQEQPKLTSHSQLKQQLNRWANSSKLMELEIIGNSVLGKELYCASFSLNFPIPDKNRTKPLALVFAQQHGNEPSGKEAVLQLCQEFAKGDHKEILQKIDLLIVPQMNPDGGEKGIRRNANNQDLNRNHILLDQPETFALHQLYFRFFPEVTLDVHEYNDFTKSRMESGWVRAIDEMLGKVTNPNISEKIKEYSEKNIVPEVGLFTQNAGFSFHPYLVGGPPETARYRYSTTYINDGRNSFGIFHSLSFIIEGRRYGDTTTKIKLRTRGQKAAVTGLLKSVAKHNLEILQLVREERQKLLNAVDNFSYFAPRSNYLNVRNVHLPLQVELVPGGSVVDTVFQNFSPNLKVPFYLKRPKGYLVPKNLKKWLDVLHRHQVIVQTNIDGHDCIVEKQVVTNIGIFEMEEKVYLDVATKPEILKFSPKASDYVFISSNQLASHFISLILEPQSVMCLLQYEGFLNGLKPGDGYPIFRVTEW